MMTEAEQIWIANTRATLREFAAREAMLRREYLDVATFTVLLSALRDERAYFVAQERELYLINLAHPLPVVRAREVA